MIDTPQIIESTAQIVATIRMTIPRSEIRTVMGPGMRELMDTVARQGITPAGPIFSHHFKMNPEIFDFEIGVPVNKPVQPEGRVKPGGLAARKVARTIYCGPYEGLGPAWGEFEKWLSANGHIGAPDLWECYITGPESGKDPAHWRTELNRPLAE